MDKVKSISCHVLRNDSEEAQEKAIEEHLKSVEESDSEESPSSDSDIMIDMVPDRQESCSADEGGEDIQFEELVTTRSGRVVGSWRNY